MFASGRNRAFGPRAGGFTILGRPKSEASQIDNSEPNNSLMAHDVAKWNVRSEALAVWEI